MKLTTTIIKEWFDKFNNEYFKGNLATPKFKTTRHKRALGFCNWKYRYEDDGSITRYDYIIAISTYFQRDEKEYQNTLLHEMIHLYIRQNNIDDGSRHHGIQFVSMANEINSFGWNIKIKDSYEGFTPENKVKYNCVTFLDLHGDPFLMCINENCIDYYKKHRLKNYNGVVFFTSEDPKFLSFPICKKNLQGKYITMDEYVEIVQEQIKKKSS